VKNSGLLRYYVISIGKSLPTFQLMIEPSSSGSNKPTLCQAGFELWNTINIRTKQLYLIKYNLWQYLTRTCFGTGVPFVGILIKQRNASPRRQLRHCNIDILKYIKLTSIKLLKLKCCDVKNTWCRSISSTYVTQNCNSMPINSIYFGILEF
jgi:hypothetical protein